MKKEQGAVVDRRGNAIGAVDVTVYNTGTAVKADLYSDNGITPQSNPFQTDSMGRWGFYVGNGRYDIEFAGSMVSPYKLTDDVVEDVGLGTGQIKIADSIYFDQTGTWADQHAHVTIVRNYPNTPTDVFPTLFILSIGKGDNATWCGNSGIYVQAKDRDDVTGSNKGVLKGIEAYVYPRVERNNTPYDDVSCIQCMNIGTYKATEGIFIGHYTGFATSEFIHGIAIEAYCDNAILINSHADYGIDLSPGTFAQAPIRIPNNIGVKARNVGGTADYNLLKLDTDNNLQFGDANTVVNYVYNNLILGKCLYVAGDQGTGISSTVGISNVTTAYSDGTGSQAPKGVTGSGNPVFAGWLKVYVGTDIRYVPYYSAIQ